MDKVVEDDVDLYEELGVAHDVGETELKKVYRKLVLKHHPDKLAGKSDEEKAVSQGKFQKLVTAYEILSDPHKRAIYDTRSAKKGGAPDDVLLNVTLKESVLGTTKLAPVPYKKKCEACKGVGMTCEPCEPCGGKPAWMTGGPKCTVCEGRGFGQPKTCTKCKGHGETEEFDMVRIAVEPGANTGTRIPVPGKDVHARVFVLPSKMFKRDGNNVESVLELTEDEAEEGGPFEVETLHGKDMIYLVGPLASGDTKALEGKGVAAQQGKGPAGDHMVRVVVKPGTRTKRPAEEEAKKPEAPDEAKKAKVAAGGAAASGGGGSDKEALAKLLAEKKAALMAKLKAKQGGGT